MEKYSRYYGVAIFILAVVLLAAGVYFAIFPQVTKLNGINSSIVQLTSTLEEKKQLRDTVERRKKQLKDSIANSQKRIYSPIDSGLENDTLFFTLYNDLIEMLHANSVKIKSIDYNYNPSGDPFVQFGKDKYFVCDVNMQVASNYVNLGKFIQDIYQYPYYIRINEIDVNPYKKDKKILISDISMRLYAHTETETEQGIADEPTLDGAQTSLPQE